MKNWKKKYIDKTKINTYDIIPTPNPVKNLPIINNNNKSWLNNLIIELPPAIDMMGPTIKNKSATSKVFFLPKLLLG